MSSFLLFCTALVPLSTINSLLNTPEHNFFSLVRDPSQTDYEPWCTKTPVEPFTTGFAGYSSEQIRAFLFANPIEGEARGSIEFGDYAILDDRSTRDDTVVIGHRYYPLIVRDPDDMEEEEREQWNMVCDLWAEDTTREKEDWFEWRVKFADVDEFVTSLTMGSDFDPKLYKPEYVGDDGVFDYKRALEEYLAGGKGEESDGEAMDEQMDEEVIQS